MKTIPLSWKLKITLNLKASQTHLSNNFIIVCGHAEPENVMPLVLRDKEEINDQLFREASYSGAAFILWKY